MALTGLRDQETSTCRGCDLGLVEWHKGDEHA